MTVNTLVQILVFHRDALREFVLARASSCQAVREIVLAGVSSVDDHCLERLLVLPALERIDVSDCLELTSASLERLRARESITFAARRCWRLWSPCPELDPRHVVELQVYALRDNSDEGIAATFAFASPSNRLGTGPVSRFGHMIRNGPL